MAITLASQDSGSVGSFNPSFSTASATAAANKLQLFFVRGSRSASDPQTPTSVAAGANTFTLITSVGFHSAAAPIRRIFVYRYLGSSFTSAITLTVAAPGWSSASWSWMELDGIDTSGTNGSGAIIQSGSTATASSSFLVSLANIASSNNALVGGWGRSNNTDDFTAGTNFTVLHNIADATFGRITTEYAIPGETDGDVDGSWSASATHGGLGLEIGAASTGAAAVILRPRFLSILGVS